ncbi:hypothetical protein BJ165DRAFT_1490624 [Panaeolus papilionaceus]|nr:hypothetical protein BJ165DRAFT_1490624 [Panaeolus papilionaceus]
MPLRALRLLATSIPQEVTHAASLSFTDTLQLAAGRAWSRRVSTHSRQDIPSRKRATRASTQFQPPTEQASPSGPSITGLAGSFSNHGRKKRDIGTHYLATSLDQENNLSNPRHSQAPGSTCLPNVVHLDPEGVDFEVYQRDPQDSRDNSVYHDIFNIVPANVMPYVLTPASTSDPCLGKSPAIPAPTSQRSLHRNLLFLLQTPKPPPSLPSLIDYHNLYPQWHSTRSCNLLIHIGLRNRSFGLVRRLLASFRENGLQRNAETYQLEIRWLILRGKWDEAWNYANRVKEDISNDGQLPLSIWLEFCRPRHILRQKKMPSDSDEDSIVAPQRHVADSTLCRSRHEVLRRHLPPSMPPLPRSSPFLIRSIVQLMVKSDHRDDALELVQNYFKVLPPHLNPRISNGCIYIIHALMVSNTSKDGLHRFYESRRTLASLLALNSSLKPTPRTLYILLQPLLRAKRCGTIAWDTLQSFKSQWGHYVEDRRVQRRVSQLALKEGRFDIVKKISQTEGFDRSSRQRQLEERQATDTLEISSINPYHRPPLRHVYTGNGREARLWFRHRMRLRRKLRNRLRHVTEQGQRLGPG